MTKITLNVEFEPGVTRADESRYVVEFKQGKATWFMFLNYDVMDDPKMMASWLKSLVNEIQVKNGL